MIKFKGVSQIEGKERRFIESCFRVLQSKNAQLNASFESPVEGARVINEFIASREIEQKEKDKTNAITADQRIAENSDLLLLFFVINSAQIGRTARIWTWRGLKQRF